MSDTNTPAPKITEDDVIACWPVFGNHYLADILNGEYSIEEAREDLLSLIGSQFDPRTNP